MYYFSEFSVKRGWLSWSDSEHDWRESWLHEFCPLKEVRDCVFKALWCKLDLFVSFSVAEHGRAEVIYSYDGMEPMPQISLEVLSGNWDLGATPEIQYLAVMEGEVVDVMTEALPAAPDNQYLKGYYYCRKSASDNSKCFGLVPSECLEWR